MAVTNEDYATRVAQFRCGCKRGRAHTRFETSRRSSNHVPDPVGSSAPSYSCRLAEPAGLLACLGDSVRRPLGAAGVGGGLATAGLLGVTAAWTLDFFRSKQLAPVSRALSSLPKPQVQTDRRVQDQRHRGDKPRRVAAFRNIDARTDNDPNPAPQSQNPGERPPVALCVHGQTIVLTSNRSLRAQGRGAVSVETTGVGADPRGTQRPTPKHTRLGSAPPLAWSRPR